VSDACLPSGVCSKSVEHCEGDRRCCHRHLVIWMAGEARDEPSSDGHPRRGFQGHRRSFPTARACAAPPAPARTKAKQHTTAKQNSNTHNQCVNSELPALLCQQAELMTQGAHWCHLCTPGLKAPTISTHKCQQCAPSHAFAARGSRVRVQGGGFETCVSAACACAGGRV